MDLFLETYYELFPDKRRANLYLFLDEIQEVSGWESFVRHRLLLKVALKRDSLLTQGKNSKLPIITSVLQRIS